MRKALLPAAAIFAAAGALMADFSGSYLVPLDHKAIQYATAPLDNRISQLQEKMKSGAVSLEYTAEHGYLESLLRELKIPVSSQVLVFSKTSFQAPRIAPRTPRALYHAQDVSVGYVMGGDVLEIAAVDPRVGTVFYTLDQEKTSRPGIERRGDCVQCHAGNATIGVPGWMVRSLHVERSGMPVFNAQSFVTDHRSPLGQRWGGWYVTGKSQPHMGNVFVEDKTRPEQMERSGTNLTDLRRLVDTSAYLAPGSDIVSLMVLEHDTRMINLITRVGYEVRMALHDQVPLNEMEGVEPGRLRDSTRRRIRNAAEELVKYLLFVDEAALESPVEGTSEYVRDFEAAGKKDTRGRSLRQVDLKQRLFRYRCSYQIYSAAFDGLPEVVREQIYRRLWEVLTGAEQGMAFAKLGADERQAILEILRETKEGLPEYWRTA